MQSGQLSFLEDDAPEPRAGGSLVLRSREGRPLTKKERAFNRLIARVEALGDRVERERRRLDDLLVFHATHVGPRLERVTALRKDVVRVLAPFLDDPRLKPGDRRVLHTILVRQMDEILMRDASPDADLRELFERLHGVGFTEAVQESIDDARSEMAAMFADLGIDVEVPELRHDMSEAELAATVAQMADSLDQIDDPPVTGGPGGRKAKRQMREEERLRKIEDARKISIGAIYKRLVKALHPDREPDPVLRERKGVLMQNVTEAYAKSDMHGLLRLELEWMGRDHAEAARLSEETLNAYTEALKQQVAELEGECLALPLHPRYGPILSMDAPLGLPRVIDGPAEVQRLDVAIEGLSAALDRVAAGNVWQEVRNLIRDERAADRSRRRRY